MPELVALELPGSQAFVDTVRRVWDAGDAVAPLDPRLPPPAARALLAALAPTAIIGPDGERRSLEGGRPVEPGDALVLGTSGTTGPARGVVLTMAALEASADATTRRLGIDPARHHWLACLPLAHIGAMAVVARAVLTGTPLTVLPGFDAGQVESLGRERIATHVALVSTALARIDPAVFETILLGGAAPPANLAANVVTTYGMTETGSGVVYDGRPLDGVEVAIDPAEGTNEILVRAPMLFRAYRDGTRPNRKAPDGSGGWFPTGDAGRWTPDGRLEVLGRLSDVVVTGGEKVWPPAVEALLATHPLVASVAVWKRPDPTWGERVVAWVVPKDRRHPPRLEALAELTRSQLPPWAAPKELVVVDELPRTPSGKVRRRALR